MKLMTMAAITASNIHPLNSRYLLNLKLITHKTLQ